MTTPSTQNVIYIFAIYILISVNFNRISRVRVGNIVVRRMWRIFLRVDLHSKPTGLSGADGSCGEEVGTTEAISRCHCNSSISLLILSVQLWASLPCSNFDRFQDTYSSSEHSVFFWKCLQFDSYCVCRKEGERTIILKPSTKYGVRMVLYCCRSVSHGF